LSSREQVSDARLRNNIHKNLGKTSTNNEILEGRLSEAHWHQHGIEPHLAYIIIYLTDVGSI